VPAIGFLHEWPPAQIREWNIWAFEQWFPNNP